MKKIIAMIQPFTLRQNVYVYEDGNKLASSAPKLDELPDTIFALSKEYDVNKVNLMGPKQYNRGLEKKIKEAEMSKFNENKLEINVE